MKSDKDLQNIIKLKKENKSIFEKFGLFYLTVFEKIGNRSVNFKELLSDEEIKKKTNFAFAKSFVLAIIVSILTVVPTIYVDLHFQNDSFWIYWSWLISVTLLCVIIEIYFLFLIALKLVHDLQKLLKLDSYSSDLISIPTFNIKNILARTALEIPDPELEVLGIDPFKSISRNNLLVISIIYKGKIFLSNLIFKYLLLFTVGKFIFGFSILYEALLVECFWNIVVLKRVLVDARLRLFGLKLSYEIIDQLKKSNIKNQLSLTAQKGCIRAIGNSVVMTKNYHPNMIFLLVHFQKELDVLEPDHFDDWTLFIQTLNSVTEKERFFLLDLFTVATAFDGSISSTESKYIEEAYGESFPKYIDRIENLTLYLKKGYFYKALNECHLDFNEG